MPLFKSSRVLEAQIDEFLDTVAEGGLVFYDGVKAYLNHDEADFDKAIKKIESLESTADTLSRDVETHLYRHSLIPEHRGDVLGLLENTDNIIDTAKMSLLQFSVERPDIPEVHHADFLKLTAASSASIEAVIICARAFFRNADAVKDTLYKVHHFEKEADTISDALKRAIFASDLNLAHKTHLRYFALNVEQVSDRSEEVADRLAIYVIKRNI
ncbi:MAG: putative phosphate transport protein (TIGR00153 family) [Candidatus Krumholzibacteriia bacterium]